MQLYKGNTFLLKRIQIVVRNNVYVSIQTMIEKNEIR